MPNPKEYLQRKATEKAAEKLPAPVLDALGKAMLKGIDKAVTTRWERALDKAARAEGATVDARAKWVTRSFIRELASLGAATGATAAAPGLGTASAASVMVADMGWFALRTTDLIMTIGAVHGHTDASAEERRAWVLAILAFGENAAKEFAQLAAEIGGVAAASGSGRAAVGRERVGALVAGAAGGDVATIDALRKLNASLAVRVTERWGTRAGAESLGKLLPFGIGAVVGGSANWALTRAVGLQSRRFFGQYHLLVVPPPPSIPPPPAADTPALPPPTAP
ncbi:MAG: hypothetical protein R2761_22625 [Acidimicrobiales bacterium]